MSTGTLCCCISTKSLYFVLTIDCLVQCKKSSGRFKRWARKKLILSLYCCVHCSRVVVLFSHLVGLSVNHYLENVPIIMLVRLKLVEEWENQCTVKKMCCFEQKLSVWQIKNIPVKITGLLFFFLLNVQSLFELIPPAFSSFFLNAGCLPDLTCPFSAYQDPAFALVDHPDKLKGSPESQMSGGHLQLQPFILYSSR